MFDGFVCSAGSELHNFACPSPAGDEPAVTPEHARASTVRRNLAHVGDTAAQGRPPYRPHRRAPGFFEHLGGLLTTGDVGPTLTSVGCASLTATLDRAAPGLLFIGDHGVWFVYVDN